MVNCHRCNGAAGRRDDGQLRTRRDVARRVHIPDRSVVAIVDDESAHLVALAAELRAEIVRRILTDREIQSLAIE